MASFISPYIVGGTTALGLLKHYKNDIPEANRRRRFEADKEKVSFMTGKHGEYVGKPSLFNTLMQGLTGGLELAKEFETPYQAYMIGQNIADEQAAKLQREKDANKAIDDLNKEDKQTLYNPNELDWPHETSPWYPVDFKDSGQGYEVPVYDPNAGISKQNEPYAGPLRPGDLPDDKGEHDIGDSPYDIKDNIPMRRGYKRERGTGDDFRFYEPESNSPYDEENYFRNLYRKSFGRQENNPYDYSSSPYYGK